MHYYKGNPSKILPYIYILDVPKLGIFCDAC